MCCMCVLMWEVQMKKNLKNLSCRALRKQCTEIMQNLWGGRGGGYSKD